MRILLLPLIWFVQGPWSDKAFGPDSRKGPIGSLRHLKREAQEAIEKPDDIVEYADCLLILLDATRRAGFSLGQLLWASWKKHLICRRREWPEPRYDDEPNYHLKKAPEENGGLS